MIFVDSNVPMYLVGSAHPNKTSAQVLLERTAAEQGRLVTDAEVIQELIHRYAAINRRSEISQAISILLRLVDEVYAIEKQDALRAAEIVKSSDRLSARDAIHLAIMARHRISRVLSFDSDFDGWPGITRIHNI